MSEEVSHDEHRCLSESSEADSEDSMEFQELKVGDKDSVNQVVWATLKGNQIEAIDQKAEKVQNLYKGLQDRVATLQRQLKQQQQKLQNEKKEKNRYMSMYKKLVNQHTHCNQTPAELNPEALKLKQQNMELKQLIENLKQQNQEYVDKINCLQKKIQLQKQENDSKLNTIKRNLQPMTKVPMKNVDNESLPKFITNKSSQMQKLFHKLSQIDEMIIEKPIKNKKSSQNNDILQQKFIVVEKVQNFLVKQQTKINNLKEYCAGVEKQLQQCKKGGNMLSTGLNKLFNPVIKLCKMEEPKQEIKKKKDNI